MVLEWWAGQKCVSALSLRYVYQVRRTHEQFEGTVRYQNFLEDYLETQLGSTDDGWSVHDLELGHFRCSRWPCVRGEAILISE